jgi:hypothetical protein
VAHLLRQAIASMDVQIAELVRVRDALAAIIEPPSNDSSEP